MIDWVSGTIEGSSKHLNTDGHLEDISGELAVSVQVINSLGSLEDLDDSSLSLDFKHLSLPDSSVSQGDIYDFCVLWELDIVKDDEWSVDIKNGSVIYTWCDVVVEVGDAHGLVTI